MTTSNKCISGRFYDCIAILPTVVGGVTAFNYHGGKSRATIESRIFNARNAIGDGDSSKGEAFSESGLSNARHTIRDGNGGEGGAILESLISNACYAVRDSDRGERGAIIESITSNARNAIRDGNGGKGAAFIESPTSNARNVVGNAIVGDDFGDSNFARIFVRVFRIITSLVSYCDVVAVKIVVVDAIYFEVMCPEGGSDKEGEEKKPPSNSPLKGGG